MCGIVGVVGRGPVNQLLYDALLLLQHRGQDAAGIATSNGNQFNMYKAHGLVRDVFRTRNMRSLPGTSGIGQVRYPTAGSSESVEEAQPFYVNAPFGITFAHNGNLTNWHELRESLFKVDQRHINTNSDSEVLLNVLAHELQRAANGVSLDESAIFTAGELIERRLATSRTLSSPISIALGCSVSRYFNQVSSVEPTGGGAIDIGICMNHPLQKADFNSVTAYICSRSTLCKIGRCKGNA